MKANHQTLRASDWQKAQLEAPEGPYSKADIEAINDPLERLLAIMACLRDPKFGCPWDLEQSFETIAQYTIEEAYEVRAAIKDGDKQALADELGDLLLQVVYHSQLATEERSFSFEDVAQVICAKMVRRHPHVFAQSPEAANGLANTSQAQTQRWEDIKAAERRSKANDASQSAPSPAPSALDGVSIGQPELMRAQKLQSRAARVGFDWDTGAEVLTKLNEEVTELSQAQSDENRLEEFGDILFTLVNYGRHQGFDSEEALRQANDKFQKRFETMEQLAKPNAELKTLDADQLEALWNESKRIERIG